MEIISPPWSQSDSSLPRLLDATITLPHIDACCCRSKFRCVRSISAALHLRTFKIAPKSHFMGGQAAAQGPLYRQFRRHLSLKIFLRSSAARRLMHIVDLELLGHECKLPEQRLGAISRFLQRFKGAGLQKQLVSAELAVCYVGCMPVDMLHTNMYLARMCRSSWSAACARSASWTDSARRAAVTSEAHGMRCTRCCQACGARAIGCGSALSLSFPVAPDCISRTVHDCGLSRDCSASTRMQRFGAGREVTGVGRAVLDMHFAILQVYRSESECDWRVVTMHLNLGKTGVKFMVWARDGDYINHGCSYTGSLHR